MRALPVILVIVVVGGLAFYCVDKWFTRSRESKKTLRRERDELSKKLREVRQIAWDSRSTDPLISDMILSKTRRKDEVEEDR